MANGSGAVLREDPSSRELSVMAEESQLSRVRDFVTEICEEAGFTPRETNNTKLAVDEACTNIIKHAYEKSKGEIKIRVRSEAGKVDISIFDSGKRFDFAGVKDPDLDQYVETGRKGGLGVFLINRLMDRVEYRASDEGNELFLTKSSRAALSPTLTRGISWRGTLRYKFTVRASVGLLVLIAAIWGYTFARQTATLREQRTTQWLEKRRLAENLSNKSKELLLRPETYSIEQTTLTAFVTQMLEGNADLAYARVVDREGTILSSGNIDEMFTRHSPPEGETLLREESEVTWTRFVEGDEYVREIRYPVRVRVDEGDMLTVGSVHLGVYEGALQANIKDPRLFTTLIVIAIFVVGVLLIMGLVSVFVKPIQVLTDGVRAIGEGSLEGKISVEGPAEIGAIAAVFNEISEKFKKAQESVLEQEKLQKEIEVAKQIQQALLPKRHPDVSGYDIAPYYQAAKEVGGDYYDFVVVDEDTLGVVVADVSGKGVPGSLVMTMIRTALRMEARGNKNASDVMAKMNDFVTDDMKKGMFVTMFYVMLDSKNRIISYASAGHNPMILFRADSKDIFFLNPKGFPVGISLPDENLFRRSISLEKVKLKKDDMLLIYTDGVTEAMNERREQYGEERLIQLTKANGHLHPKKFIKVLEDDIKQFTGGTAQNDDITVVAVKEKLTADDVLFGIRKKLIDMVDVMGMSVKEACAKMKVSPATYYRYRKRMALMGDRGLRNKVLRQDVDLKRVSIEERRALIKIIRAHPEFGAKRITQEYNKIRDAARQLTEKMVYDELRRLSLNTKELRLEYLKRNRLLAEEPEPKTSKEIVEELLQDVAAEAAEAEDQAEPSVPEEVGVSEQVGAETLDPVAAESFAGVRIDQTETEEGVAVLTIGGHLDSVSSTSLEKKLREVISNSFTKIVVNLSAVSYISSGGWGILVGEVRRLRENAGDVVLVGMTAEVHDVYELLGFSEILKAFTGTEEALDYFRKPVEERFTRPVTAPVGGDESVVHELSGADDEQSVAYGPEWESLQIEATTVGEKGDIAVISLRGIIDTISAERLRAAIDRVIKSGIVKVVIDLSQVEYVSSGGWGTFTERLREVRRRDGDIKLFGMDPDVYYVFTMLGFNIVLSSFDILSEAIEEFGHGPAHRPNVHPEQSAPVSDMDMDMSEDDEIEDQEVSVDLFDSSSVAHEERSSPQRIEWDRSQGVPIAVIHGTMEASSVEEIDEQFAKELASQPSFLIVDMHDVDYVSSTGWGLFAKYHEQMSRWGGKITLCDMSADLIDIFDCLEFHSFISVYGTRDEAVRACPGVSAAAPSESVDRDVAIENEEEEILELSELVESDVSAEEETVKRSTPDTAGDGLAVDDELTEEDLLLLEEHAEIIADPEKETRSDDRTREFEGTPDNLDVDAGVTDDHIADDSKLRDMGWEKYGERLKKKLRGKTKTDDEEGSS